MQEVIDLFDAWYPSLLRHAARLTGSVDLAEDVVQEAFFLYNRELQARREVRYPKAWTLRVVWRLVRRGFAIEEHVPIETAEIEEPAAVSCPPQVWEGDGQAELMALLDRLSPREEQVILLRMEAMKYREIAEALEITPQTVHVLIKRAVKKLRAALEERRTAARAPRTLH